MWRLWRAVRPFCWRKRQRKEGREGRPEMSVKAFPLRKRACKLVYGLRPEMDEKPLLPAYSLSFRDGVMYRSRSRQIAVKAASVISTISLAKPPS